MIISLGMLIDNAIVMAESITVRISAGRRPVDAAVLSAREFRGPLLVSSLTTAAAFLPIYLAQSTTGEYTAPLFTVVTVTLLSSWVLAVTVTPLLCVRFLRVGPVRPPERFRGPFYRWYRRLLLAGLRRRGAALAALAGLLLLALQGSRHVPRAFFPPSDKAVFTAEYMLPPGMSIERTLEVVEAVDRFIAGELAVGGAGTLDGPPAGVTNWVTFVGDRGPRFYASHRPGPPDPRQALSILNATGRGVITADLIPRLQAFCLERFPDLDAVFSPLAFGPPIAAPVEVRLSGRDQDVLFGIVDTVAARMRSIPGARSVDELRRTVVTLPGRSEIVHLEDLAEISRGWLQPPTYAVRASGAPAVVFGVSMRDGGDITELGAAVEGTLDRLRAHYPVGLEFDVVAFQPEVVETLLRAFFGNLLQAVVVVLGVSLAVLGLRTGLVVAVLVPMSMVAGLPVMAALGVGINQVTLAAMIISLGMLIDNAIVMAESITVRIAAGRTSVDSAVLAARELRGPLLVSSLTTAAAFLPIYLAESTTGEYTAPLFTVVSVTLLSSWVLAVTVTPLLCVRFLRIRPLRSPERFRGPFYRWYRRLLLAGLRHRAAALAALAGLLLVALQGSRHVPRAFFPPSDKAVFTAEYVLPPGTSIERTIEVMESVDRFIAAELAAGGAGAPDDAGAGVTNWVTFIGDRGPRFYASHRPGPPEPRRALSILNASDRDLITADLIPRLQAFCLDEFPDLDAVFSSLAFGPPVAAPVEVRLSGRDQDVLFDLVDAVSARMRSIPGAGSVSDDWGGAHRKIFVEVDQPRARRAATVWRSRARANPSRRVPQEIMTTIYCGIFGDLPLHIVSNRTQKPSAAQAPSKRLPGCFRQLRTNIRGRAAAARSALAPAARRRVSGPSDRRPDPERCAASSTRARPAQSPNAEPTWRLGHRREARRRDRHRGARYGDERDDPGGVRARRRRRDGGRPRVPRTRRRRRRGAHAGGRGGHRTGERRRRLGGGRGARRRRREHYLGDAPEPTKNGIRGWVRGAWTGAEGAVRRAKAAAERGIERSIAASGRLLIRGADSTERALRRSTDAVRGLWRRAHWSGI